MDLERLSSRAAHRLLSQKDRLLEVWAERVRQALPAAAAQPHPILINTMPRFLRYLAEALSAEHPRQNATEGTTLAQEHGGERVRITGYGLGDLIREYQLLRDVLLEELDAPEPLTEAERATLLKSIDQAVCESCTAYALVAEGLREKFMLTLAHDLRGPLTAARAGAQMILRKPDSREVPRWAARVVEGVDRVDAMVRDLLDVARVGSGRRLQLELAPCELVALARGVVENMELTHGQRFVLVAKESAVHGHWSSEALRRALENLMTNAVKYGSTLEPITVTVGTAHDRAQLSVHNHGPHIPAEEQETLFQAFHRRHDAQKSGKGGWGLGLALGRAVAEAHGGSIEVSSLPERGTTFTIDIPQDARPFQDRAHSS
jgi:signal transduction histidine kinase